MSVDYARLPTQFGAVLQILGKIEARQIHARDASDSNYDRRLVSQSLAFAVTDDEESRVLGAIVNYLDQLEVPRLRTLYSSLRGQIENQGNGLGYLLSLDLPNLTDDDSAVGWISYTYDDQLTDGTVAISVRRGTFGALRRDMEENGQYVEPGDVDLDVLIADSHTVGELVNYEEDAEPHCPTCDIIVRCSDDSVTRPEFVVTLQLDKPLPDGSDIIVGANALVAEKSWEDGPTGLTLTLRRAGLDTPTELTDTGAVFSGVTIATPRSSDCDLGNFFQRTTRQSSGNRWLLEFFADSGLTRKRGRYTTNTLTGNQAFSVTLSGGTVIAGTFNTDAAAVAMGSAGDTETASWDIRQPRRGDVWRMRAENLNLGAFNNRVRQTWRASFPQSGTTKWTDSLATVPSMSV